MIPVKNVNLVMALLSVFVVRAIVMGAGLGDSLIVLGLCAVYGYMLHQGRQDEAFKKEVLEHTVRVTKDVEDLKAIVGNMKLANSLRGAANVPRPENTEKTRRF